MRGEAVPESVAGGSLRQANLDNRAFHSSLQDALVHVMSVPRPLRVAGIAAELFREEDILPCQLTLGVRVFPAQRVRQVRVAQASLKVRRMLCMDFGNLISQILDILSRNWSSSFRSCETLAGRITPENGVLCGAAPSLPMLAVADCWR